VPSHQRAELVIGQGLAARRVLRRVAAWHLGHLGQELNSAVAG
jgi:hypothetical protein